MTAKPESRIRLASSGFNLVTSYVAFSGNSDWEQGTSQLALIGGDSCLNRVYENRLMKVDVNSTKQTPKAA
jgi:hypothetical protein